MTRLFGLWRTTTVRLTALFIAIFIVFAVALLGVISYQIAISIQRQQSADIEREIARIERADRDLGLRATMVAVQRLAARPGPGIYYLGDPVGQMLAGNVTDIPSSVLQTDGFQTFNYARPEPFSDEDDDERERPRSGPAQGSALVKSVVLPSGLRLVVGRDIVERRGFAAIIVHGFLWGTVGIIVFSMLAGGLTARRVLRRIDQITGTATKIMGGSMSERVPVTRAGDEFDRLAESLNRMLDRIEQLMTGLKEVTDNVAHDLKTPLTRLRNRAEAALREDADKPGQRAALEAIISESDQLIRTFNALLLIARVEAGTPSGAFAQTDISAVVEDVAELYAPVAEDEGLTLETDIKPGLHLSVNRELIGQALVNLVENAIKYGRPASGQNGTIRMEAYRQNGQIILEVADRGPGIPDAERNRVLERFVRLEKSRTAPGSGLGLSLVAAVANLHKGALRFEDNRPGVRAILSLPERSA